ncbi:MAG: hypothetical protein KC478_07765 [Bacteriovoracaceae bacterium]|nr:hypothetical protein [Bacteriovoracaceae bacterium]
MLRFVIFLTFILGHNAVASSKWTPISPLDYCPEFQIEFTTTHDGEYKVRIPTPSGPQNVDQKLEDINDLSSLTDILVDASLDVCAKDNVVLAIERDEIILEVKEPKNYHNTCRQPYDFNRPYIDFIKEMVGVLQFSGNRCDQLMAYTKLQTKIDQLSDEELIKFKRPGNIFHRFIQAFTGGDTDKMIDLFATCGGEKFSHKFVENLILIEAKNSCVIPAPPGIMSFEDAQSLAQDIASNYKNMGIMDLSDKTEEITHKTIMALTSKTMNNEVESLLGQFDVNAEEFIHNLDAYKELNKKKLSSENIDYVTSVFAIDATLEVADKALPILAKETFAPRLPVTWSDSKKEDFLNQKLLPSVKEVYQACMQDSYKRVGFNSDLDTASKLKLRTRLKENYCKQYPEQCQGLSCNEKVNIIGGNPNTKDTQVVQGCVMKSMILNIKPIIKNAIADQKDTFKEYFDLNDALTQKLTDASWDKMLTCADTKLANHLGVEQSSNSDKLLILEDSTRLQQVPTDVFTQIIGDCGQKAEGNVAKNLYTLTLKSQPTLKQSFALRAGEKGPSKLNTVVNDVIVSAYGPCMTRQDRLVKSGESSLTKVDPVLCRPLVEMSAAHKVVDKTLNDLYKDYKIDKSAAAKLTLKQFENCSDAALNKGIRNLGAQNSPRSIASTQDANTYMDKDPSFLKCVKEAIADTTTTIGGVEFDKSAASMGDTVKDIEYFKSLKSQTNNEVKQCFVDGLNKIPTWSEFNEFNEQDGINRLKDKCSAKALEFVLPKVLLKEASLQMNEIQSQGLVKDNAQSEQIIENAAKILKNRYSLRSTGPTAVFKGALKAHIKAGGTQDSFIKEFSAEVKDVAVETIHSNLADKIVKMNPRKKYQDFFNALTPQCVGSFLNQYDEHLNLLITKMNETEGEASSKTVEETIVDMIYKGLEYQKGLGESAYNAKVNDIKDICTSPSLFKTPMQLARTQAFDFILKASVQGILDDSFMDVAHGQCHQDMKEHIPEKDYNEPKLMKQIAKACNARAPIELINAFGNIKSQFFMNKELVKMLDFMQSRHLEMLKLIRSEIIDSKKLEETLFNDDQIISTIHENFLDVATGNPEIKDELTAIIITKLFEKKGPDSFADNFVGLQLEAGLGLSGYKTAKAQINAKMIDDAVGWLDLVTNKNRILELSHEALDDNWTPHELHGLFAWDEIEQAQKEMLIDAVYKNAVIPSITGTEADTSQLTEKISDHLGTYMYKRHKATFTMRLTERISDHVKSDLTDIIGIE